MNLVERTLEYSRPINSLKLWLALRTHGAAEFRRWIEHTLGLAAELTARLRDDPEFELLHEPQLSTVCFRHAPVGVADLTPTTRPWPMPPSATAACSWPTRWWTGAAACACAS